MGRLIERRGFTLVELMVTIAIAAILIGIAIPSFQNITLRSRQTNTLNHFAAAVGRARSEAVTRPAQIVLCASANSTAPNPVCSGANAWEGGWIMFVDLPPRDQQYQPAERLLQIGEPLPAGTTVRGIGFTATDRLVFSSGTGLLNTGGGFRYCDTRGFAEIRVLNVGVSGQIRIATDSNGDGLVEDGNVVTPPGTGTAVNSCI